ncbi:hypothetical protein PSCICN_51080 [Pseudomonas cichorii]|nr:hypothetical protein PSCICN_51080 [Pseudomonas cichorii]
MRTVSPTREYPAMSKPKRPNKAKSIIAQPLFRSRQERPAKGKGSYRREAFQSKSWEASCFLAA